jgi:hypothetical protein
VGGARNIGEIDGAAVADPTTAAATKAATGTATGAGIAAGTTLTSNTPGDVPPPVSMSGTLSRGFSSTRTAFVMAAITGPFNFFTNILRITITNAERPMFLFSVDLFKYSF